MYYTSSYIIKDVYIIIIDRFTLASNLLAHQVKEIIIVYNSLGAVIIDGGISVGGATVAVVGQTGGGWQVGHAIRGGQEGQVTVGH